MKRLFCTLLVLIMAALLLPAGAGAGDDIFPRTQITICAASQEWEYDGETHSNSEVRVVLGELKEGHTLHAKATGSVKTVADTAPGNNPIAPDFKIMYGLIDVTDEYSVMAIPGTLTIKLRPATVKADDLKKYYGDPDPKLTATVTGTVGKDKLTYTVSRESGEEPGMYILTPAGQSIQGNYVVTYELGSFQINKAQQPKPDPPKWCMITMDSITLEACPDSQYRIEGGDWQNSTTFNNLEPYTLYTFYQRTSGDDHHDPSPSSDGASFRTSQVWYTITFENYDGTVLLQKDYAYRTPAKDIEVPPDPTRPDTAQYSYVFAGWDPAISDVTWSTTYTATYNAVPRKDPIPPAGEMLPKLESNGAASLKLSWTQMKNVDGYDVLLAKADATECKLIASLGADQHSLEIDRLKKKTCYKAYVQAWVYKADGGKDYVASSLQLRCSTGSGTGSATNPKSIKLDTKSLTVPVGVSKHISASVKGMDKKLPLIKAGRAIRYQSANPAVAEVTTGGTVTGVSAGTCTIRVIACNGMYRTVSIRVPTPPKSLSFPKKSYKVSAGKTLDLGKKLEILPSGAKTSLTWKSSDKKIATVSGKGVVTGVKKGKATITVHSSNGLKVKITVKVR